MEFVPVVAMAALTLKLMDFVRYLKAGDSNGVITQFAAWVIGVVVTVLVAQTDWADGISVGDMTLGTINIWSLIFVGLAAGSTASVVKDVGYKALDNNNTAAIPTLLSRSPRRPVGPEDVG